ncbi:hypothetical protein IJH02_03800 [Candidatus Saccharibacteria bacterium]|nr:hypothetical protein [Candidatus Saccharibacteria bacterium]
MSLILWSVAVSIAALVAFGYVVYCVVSGVQAAHLDKLERERAIRRAEREQAFIEELFKEDFSDVEVEDL